MSDPPFYGNFDGTHCLQCCLRSALEQLEPWTDWSWPTVDDFSGKIAGKFSWTFKPFVESTKLGLSVIVKSEIDPAKFALYPERYLWDFYGPDGAPAQIDNSDLKHESFYARRIFNSAYASWTVTRTSKLDILELISSGYLIIIQVNPYKLDDEPGYGGHFILIFNTDGEMAYFHDSGGADKTTWRSNRCIELDKIINAATENNKIEGLMALGPKESYSRYISTYRSKAL